MAKENADSLNPQTTDHTVSVIKSIAGAAPIIGPSLCELVGTLIPNQRIDRIVKFVKILDQKVSNLESERIREKLANEECADLFEETVRQAISSTSDERRQYLASILANSLSEKSIIYTESKHLLKILSEINDIEVIWLRYYAHACLTGDNEFRDKHTDVLTEKHAFVNASQEDSDKAALQKSYKEHLARLNLIHPVHRTDFETNLPIYDDHTGNPKIDRYEITPLGDLLLRHMDLINKNDAQ